MLLHERNRGIKKQDFEHVAATSAFVDFFQEHEHSRYQYISRPTAPKLQFFSSIDQSEAFIPNGLARGLGVQQLQLMRFNRCRFDAGLMQV